MDYVNQIYEENIIELDKKFKYAYLNNNHSENINLNKNNILKEMRELKEKRKINNYNFLIKKDLYRNGFLSLDYYFSKKQE